jgi:ABC-type nitrate/sulfonate/bicarbonate transport system permease component
MIWPTPLMENRHRLPFLQVPLRRMHRIIEPIAVALLVAVVWQITATLVGSAYFPPLSQVFARLQAKWFSGPSYLLFMDPGFIRDIIPSIGRALVGFFIAGILGVTLGLYLGLSRRLADFVDPLIHFARALPAVTLLPLFLLLLGLGTTMKLSLITFGTVWPILLNTIYGVRAVDPQKVETATAFGITGVRRVLRIMLPAASPQIFAGLRVSLALSLILMVVSEMVAATGGLGFSIVEAQRRFAIRDMWAGIVLLGLVGYLLNIIFLAIEKRVLRWHYAASRVEGA